MPTNLISAMTKAVSVPLGLILILAGTFVLPAQTNSPVDLAVSEAVLRQADTVVLRQKLVQARDAATHGDLVAAARLYEDAYSLVQTIGSGIPAETEDTISGLVAARFELAREAQRQGDIKDLLDADTQISRVLKVDPKNSAALDFKRRNDRMIAALRGQVPTTRPFKRSLQLPARKWKLIHWCETANCFTRWVNLKKPRPSWKRRSSWIRLMKPPFII